MILWLRRLAPIAGLLLLSACPSMPVNTADRTGSATDESVKPAPDAERSGRLLPVEKSSAPNVLDLDLSDVPEEYRHTVLKWIEYYQGRGRPHMDRYLSRSTRFIPLFQTILKKHDMPEDLVYLALIESGFSLRAKSHASAVGPWQFIKGTGKRYGLQINRWLDERQDPVKSTEAAALYLKGLYNLFGSWYLAIASYNVGEMRIQRSVMKYYTRSFWELAHRRVLPAETIDYIPKFIAAGVIARHPQKYGFTNIEFEKPMEFEEYVAPQTVDLKVLAKEIGIDYEELADMNAMYKTRYAIVQSGSALVRIPVGSKEKVAEVIAKAYSNVRYVATNSPSRDDTPDASGTYRVRPGDTLYDIARLYGTTVEVLKDMNDIKRGSVIKVGARLTVPERNGGGSSGKGRKKTERVNDKSSSIVRNKPLTQGADRTVKSKSARALATTSPKARYQSADSKSKVSKSSSRTSKSNSDGTTIHVVRPGDTLLEIARRYNISLSRLIAQNNLRKSGKVLIGRALIVSN
ncbi:MAG: LysM peptidoglycan-binding domain-containing protein [Bdellovibrionia bacterium]